MSVVLFFLLLIYELIQQAALVNFMLLLKISKSHFKYFERKIFCLVGSYFLKRAQSFQNSTVQTAMISKVMIKFSWKFQIHTLSALSLESSKSVQNQTFEGIDLTFDKSHHLCALSILGYCFTVPQFRFKHAEIQRLFNLTNKTFTKKYRVQK